jgi:murein DD-endopeptidase MepM/ murein hydrolase activator NlpD
MQKMLAQLLAQHSGEFHPIVPFHPTMDSLVTMDFTAANPALTLERLRDTPAFADWVSQHIAAAGARYGIGGYAENRVLYQRSLLFDGTEARSLHLGIDIWAPAGTPVMAPLGGMVHSFAFNDHFGDYGATILLQHQLDAHNFYTLYGHLSLRNLDGLREGQFITRGENFAHFGPPAENGHWPPHLHFQVIDDIGQYVGDYPGVCAVSEAEKFLANSPDPSYLLNWR